MTASVLARGAGLALALAACACDRADRAVPRGAWTIAAPMPAPRAWHSLTALPSGELLVAGGYAAREEDGTGTPLDTALLYDPATGAWRETGSLRVARAYHPAVLLRDGRVLVAGGCAALRGGLVLGVPGCWCETTATAELYDPRTGRWTETASMGHPRLGPDASAALLADGRVLVAGSWQYEDEKVGRSAEVFDPVSETWTEVGALNVGRVAATMARLPSGKVLVVGGFADSFPFATATAELYDPATARWTLTAPIDEPVLRNTLTVLATGEVLLTSGCQDVMFACAAPLRRDARLYDPATGTWRRTAPMTYPRLYASAVPLRSGEVLVAGGNSFHADADTERTEYYVAPAADVYDPWLDAWTPTPAMPRYVLGDGAAAPLPEGDVLFTGGEIHLDTASGCADYRTIDAALIYRE